MGSDIGFVCKFTELGSGRFLFFDEAFELVPGASIEVHELKTDPEFLYKEQKFVADVNFTKFPELKQPDDVGFRNCEESISNGGKI